MMAIESPANELRRAASVAVAGEELLLFVGMALSRFPPSPNETNCDFERDGLMDAVVDNVCEGVSVRACVTVADEDLVGL